MSDLTTLSYTKPASKHIGFILLMFFLCAFFVHSEHVVASDNALELNDCHLCHQGGDIPPTTVGSLLTFSPILPQVISFYVPVLSLLPYQGLALLRAPPIR